MSSLIAIRVRGLGKAYNPHSRGLAALFSALGFSGSKGQTESEAIEPEQDVYWALRNIDLDVYKGEVLGVIGRNGAGKTTLMQLISGLLRPTRGSVSTAGALTSVLELGSGLSADYTGKENVFLYGQLLGISAADLQRQYDDIVAFADLGAFIDQPLRTYSSGMAMRLAFAVQTAVTPDILLVDEALSVGDVQFQQKCFQRLKRLREQGTTILMVTHDINLAASYCDRVALLDAGSLLGVGSPLEMTRLYLERAYAPPDKGSEPGNRALPSMPRVAETRFGTQQVMIESVEILDDEGRSVQQLISKKRYTLRQRVRVQTAVPGLSSGFLIRTKSGLDLFGATNQTLSYEIGPLMPGTTFDICMKVQIHLAAGHYFLLAANAGLDGTQYDCHVDALYFQVIGSSAVFTTSLVDLEPELHVVMHTL